jgi:dTDP-4-amino-4,6-dideoxygalactose transaminase
MDKKIVLFHPYVPEEAKDAVRKVLDTRWIGQGPQVDVFEEDFEDKFSSPHKAVAVGSGTDAIHLAYILAGIGEGDEVICPVFTCAATNIPLLYQKAKPIFADINKEDMNISVDSIRHLISDKTKAIVTVDYGGMPCDYKEIQNIASEYKIPVIEDACQAHGASYMGEPVGSFSDYTAFSFQAIKLITTGDGGMLTIGDESQLNDSRIIRWFGIDRRAKLESKWDNNIVNVGYKYQMNDIAAALGIAALKSFDEVQGHQRKIFNIYRDRLAGINDISVIEEPHYKESSLWLTTVIVEGREALQKKLQEHNIESGQVHSRNDIYEVFGGRIGSCPNMDDLEDKYLILPNHMYVTGEDADRICKVISSGW